MCKAKHRSLRHLFDDAGYTQRELAAACGMSNCNLSLMMNGKAEWTGKVIKAICELLNIPQNMVGYYFFPELKGGE